MSNYDTEYNLTGKMSRPYLFTQISIQLAIIMIMYLRLIGLIIISGCRCYTKLVSLIEMFPLPLHCTDVIDAVCTLVIIMQQSIKIVFTRA